MKLKNINKLSKIGVSNFLFELFDGLINARQSMDEDSMKDLAKIMIANLDDLDEDDFFGTEGWRHTILGED